MQKLILLFVCAVFSAIFTYAQDTLSSDGLFEAARKARFDKNNAYEAIRLSKKALLQSPDYADIRIFLGRLYVWDKQYDSAAVEFTIVLNKNPDNEDAIIAYSDMEYWNDNYIQALQLVNSGLSHHPQSKDLLLRKAKILNAKRDYTEAYLVIKQLLDIDKSNTEARALLERVRENSAKNSVSLSYDYVYFDKQFSDPWHLLSVDYGRQTKLGSIFVRLNYANRFREDGYQYELESYPRISKTFYSYVGAGYSDNVGVFPHWRAGFSLYANLPASMEAEAGLRYLYFSDPTFIYTASLSKYYKSFLFGIRAYVTPDHSDISHSYTASMRYYYSNIDDYIGFTAGTGISPDERSLVNQLNDKTYNLKTYKAGINLRHSIKKINIINLGILWNNQEYQVGEKGNQIQGSIGYQRRF